VKRIVLIASLALVLPRLQENPRAARYNDVERGFFVGFQAGYMGLLNTPVKEPARFPSAGSKGGTAGGMLVAAEIGKDLTPHFSLSAFAQGANERAKVSYGAFSLYAAGVDARYAYVGRKDRNDWERFFLYVHGRAGYAVTYPKGLFGNQEFILQLGPGVEYFTRLRHFSIGASIDYVRAFKASSNGFAIYPTVRYTF